MYKRYSFFVSFLKIDIFSKVMNGAEGHKQGWEVRKYSSITGGKKN